MTNVPTPPSFTGPRLRSWPVVVVAATVALWGYTVHPALGIALTVFAIGAAFRFPDAEDEYAAHLAERRWRIDVAQRRARAASVLDPTGEVEVDGARRRARMLVGNAAPGTELEVVNEVDGELVVRRR